MNAAAAAIAERFNHNARVRDQAAEQLGLVRAATEQAAESVATEVGHSTPDSTWTKAELRAWIEGHGGHPDSTLTKAELLEMAGAS
jgi:hypothetical protein